MKSVAHLVLLTAGVLASLSLSVPAAQHPKAAAPAPAPAIVAATPIQIPQSIFNVPTSPKEGRNPFFPRSTATGPVTPVKTAVVDTSSVVLNGITSPPKRTAMINGRTFEVGEEGEVRTPGGAKILIKCLEIKNDAAVVSIGGERRELRLRFGI